MNRLTQNKDLKALPFFFSFRKESTGPLEIFHAHKGMEVMYVHEGGGHLFLEDQTLEIAPDTLLIFPPFQLHRLVINEETPFIRTLLIFDSFAVEHQLDFLPHLRTFFRQGFSAFPRLVNPIPGKDQLNFLLEAFDRKRHAGPAEQLLESFQVFMISLLQHFDYMFDSLPGSWKPEKAEVELHHHAEKIVSWIEEHFTEEFALDDLSRDLHLSTWHISHLFSKATGTSISSYVLQRRLNEACLLLKATSLPVNQIGRMVGIPNIPHFCTVFRKTMKLSPGAYRKHFLFRSEAVK
jgi:AraC family transcriptional regulator, arabinose operon regulatory protein